jgi:hypothetical protein
MRIDEMQAGREMDVLIAEKVMGWAIHSRNIAWWVKVADKNEVTTEVMGFTYGKDRFAPSTDIADAWQVVKHMKKQRWSFRFSNNAYADEQNAAAFYQAFRGIGLDILTGLYVYEDKAWAVGDECTAICLAALKAMGVEEI